MPFRGEEVVTDGIENVLTDFNEKQEKICLWDFDSLVHHVLYSGFAEELDENGKKVRNPEYTEADLPLLKEKMDEMYMKVMNNIEQYFTISALYIFIRGKGNFRKALYESYKSNRPPINPLITPLYQYAKDAHGAIESNGYEAEDYVFTASKKIGHDGIIIYLDHDLEEIPSIFYNYQRNKWLKLDKKQAKYCLYKKLTIGEPGDGVNLSPKIGIKYFENNFSIDFTDQQYEEALLAAYVKAWKGDVELAKEKLQLAKQLFCLKEVENQE